jgi:hypothetical protein
VSFNLSPARRFRAPARRTRGWIGFRRRVRRQAVSPEQCRALVRTAQGFESSLLPRRPRSAAARWPRRPRRECPLLARKAAIPNIGCVRCGTRYGQLNGLQRCFRGRAGLRLRRGRPVSEREKSDLLHAGNLWMPGAVGDCRCAGWWKAFTIRSNPLELGHRFRYIMPVHTTHRGCPETLILLQFSRSTGPWQRIPPSPPVLTFAASDRHKVPRLMVTRCILLACRFSHSAANLLAFLTAVSAQLVLPSQLGLSLPPRFPASV